ncbi:DNA utilization protein GntX [Pantoea sp. 1.19]|uniref:DNA utilization protein GntX n=1 Tax=Pantoea sp. 1.19 TaxID=1925589 RepID=UPI0009489DD1|nr:DNA utilization protein GntX [Pantoea sp. 1.19]
MLSMPARCWLCEMPLRLPGHGICSLCLRSLPSLAVCPRCGLPSAHPALACGRCLLRPPPWQRLVAVSDYSPPLSTLVTRFKFHRTTALTAPLARLILLRWLSLRRAQAIVAPDLLLSVPLHRRRVLRRGFNQAALLARQLAHWLGCEYAADGLRRIRHGRAQRALSAAGRRRNLRGAFRLALAVAGRHVAIVDDVVTTGSTVGELCRLLQAAGAASVQVWCLCRTL